jgi:Mg-chelatase subunit ChlD
MRSLPRPARLAGPIACVALVVLPLVLARPLLAQPDPGRSDCRLQLDKRADPTLLLLGERTTITLMTASACPERVTPVHVVMALDTSSSMLSDGKLPAAKSAALGFVQTVDLSVNRVGVVAFAAEARVATELTDRYADISAAIDGLTTTRGTNIAAGIDVAREVVRRGRPATGTAPIDVIMVMSDGRQSEGQGDGTALVLAAADRAKADGILIITVCFGDDCEDDVMRQAASRPELYARAGSGASLAEIFRSISQQLVATTLKTLSIVDALPENMQYVEGSAVPAPAERTAGWLRWAWTVVPESGVVVTYQLQPLQAGLWPTNIRAEAAFLDTEDKAGSGVFPVPQVRVVAPTPTPGPTPVPVPLYLPILLKEHCDPRVASTDVALVLDVSDSMNQPTQPGGITKREAARRAAQRFVGQLRLPADQVAVIAFSDAAQLLAPLGANRQQVNAALQRLPQSAGTRIDAGLLLATDELTGPRHRPANHPALLLLTDGQPTRSGEPEVRAAAARARAAGITVFAIGLGADVNPALLTALAGDPARYVAAPQAEDLERIYSRLAPVLPCPGGRHDWSRPWP